MESKVHIEYDIINIKYSVWLFIVKFILMHSIACIQMEILPEDKTL